MENIDDMDVEDVLPQTLRARCPEPSLNAALPWDTLTGPERAAWRAMGDAALELCAPAESTDESRIAYLIALRREMHRQTTDRLRPYLRHLEGCPQAPCTCGLAALLP